MREPQRQVPRTTLVFRLRLSKRIRALEDALVAANPRWENIDRALALETAVALEADAQAQGLGTLAILARSMAALMNLPQDQILSISIPFREAVRDLLKMIKEGSDRVLVEAG